MNNEAYRGYRGNASLKAANVPVSWTQEMIAEYIKCRDDIIYFIEKYIKIITEDGIVPITLRDYQKEFIKSMSDNRFTICMMGRQQGKTESVRAFMIHYILFNEQKTVGLLANKEATACEILGKIQIAYQNLPTWLQVGVKEWNKKSFILENGSRVIASATSSDSIRGYTLQACLIDESAHIDNADEFFASVLPTISAGKETKLIMVSTPNGLNLFHKIWTDSEKGLNDYHRVRATWRDVPGRDEKWKKMALGLLHNNTEKFNQEYECQFLGSSGTLISGWKLSELSSSIPIHQNLDIFQYKSPEKNRIYIGIADVSRGKGLDYSALQIIDVTEMPYQQVCVYRNNMTTPADFAELINRLGRMYNNASMLVEVNDIGQQVGEMLYYDYEYENLLFTESAGAAGKRITSGVTGSGTDKGIRTTKTVKSIGCSMLKLLIEQNQLIINDENTIQELSTFSKKNQTYQAERGRTDDLVMCLVLFAWLTEQKYFKDLTDINTLLKLKEVKEEQIEEQLIPFGFIENGLPSENIELVPDLDVWMKDTRYNW